MLRCMFFFLLACLTTGLLQVDCAGAASPSVVPVLTQQQLTEALESPDGNVRPVVVEYVRRLGPSQLELLSDLVSHEHWEVRAAALAALAEVGDERARSVLRSCLADTARVRADWYPLTSSILRLRDETFLEPLREQVEAHPAEHVRKALLRTIAQIEAGTWGIQPVRIYSGSIGYDFLLEDVECMWVGTQVFGFVKLIPPGQHRGVLDALQSPEPAGESPGPFERTLGYVVMELRDGRRVEIEVCNAGTYNVAGHSFGSARLDSIVGNPDVPPRLDKADVNCSDILEGESPN
ncbi:MAG: hypothetical protein GF405_03055 [Candidatus Eisenbacteria bacterium]|nr:hypothetical protein [Candidatus Eisenbacteria bacterium]